jgi:tRNA dimethylallyltransferase
VLAIAGPTAAGKSALAHAVALALGGEIVVADPFQRYRGLEIAADSPTEEARREVPYHCVGDLRLDESSTASDFADHAHRAIDACMHADRVPVVSGGTGLYMRAALSELDFPASAERQDGDWAEGLAAQDLDAAVRALHEKDPEAAARIDKKNPRRVARALAIAAAGERPRASAALWSRKTRHPTLVVVVTRPREVLDGLIATRIQRELDDGLVAELEAALDTPGVSREAMQIIGAKEVAALCDGSLQLSELPERLAARTRRLSRKQLTWLKKSREDLAIDLGEAPATDALGQVLDVWHQERGVI